MTEPLLRASDPEFREGTKLCPQCESDQHFVREVRRETYTCFEVPVTVRIEVDVCQHCRQTLYDGKRDATLVERVREIAQRAAR